MGLSVQCFRLDLHFLHFLLMANMSSLPFFPLYVVVIGGEDGKVNSHFFMLPLKAFLGKIFNHQVEARLGKAHVLA